MIELRHYAGSIYRTQSCGGHFGQIQKIGNKWHAVVRSSESGELVRYAGIWNSRKEAHEELEHILVPAPLRSPQQALDEAVFRAFLARSGQ